MQTIETEHLTRTFGALRAVDDLNLTVEEGEIFGLLGPNGAGKTTTIRMLTGQLRPTSGAARVAGFDIQQQTEALKSRIGVVWEYQNLYERSTGRDNLRFYARLYGVNPSRVGKVLALVGLEQRGRDTVRTYSNGMKQRLLIARALLHEPRVLFLDEPTRGLDPTVGREIRRLIAGLAEQGVTVFLTTHYMEEADQLCRRVAFMNQGRIVALDVPQRLKVQYGERSVRAVLQDGEIRTFSLDAPQDGQLLGELVAAGRIQTMHTTEATLEEVFIRLTGRRLVE